MKRSRALEFGCAEQLHTPGLGNLLGIERFGHCLGIQEFECVPQVQPSGCIESAKALLSCHTGIILSRLQRLLIFNERVDNCTSFLAELFSFAQVSSLALLGDR